MDTESAADIYMEWLVSRDTLLPAVDRRHSIEEKIRRLETLQKRIFEAYKRRAEKGGPPVPHKWFRWHRAQQRASDQNRK